eukprot:c16516_g1_i3 orf=638-922(+)
MKVGASVNGGPLSWLCCCGPKHRRESLKEEDRGGLTTEEEESVQFKKPKVGALNNLSAGVSGTERQGPGRSDSKTWQGWRGQGDYRMLKPPPRR